MNQVVKISILMLALFVSSIASLRAQVAEPEKGKELAPTEQWEKIPDNDSQLVMGCIVVRNDFLKNNKAAVDNFLAEYVKDRDRKTKKVEIRYEEWVEY